MTSPKKVDTVVRTSGTTVSFILGLYILLKFTGELEIRSCIVNQSFYTYVALLQGVYSVAIPTQVMREHSFKKRTGIFRGGSEEHRAPPDVHNHGKRPIIKTVCRYIVAVKVKLVAKREVMHKILVLRAFPKN